MKTKVLKVDVTNIDSSKIEEAASLIDRGGLVAIPTETVYGIACRVQRNFLSKLDKLKCRSSEKYYTLHIGKQNDVRKYVPTIGIKANKLIEKAWPGPLTIVFELAEEDIEKERASLEKEVFESLYKDNTIGIRCPSQAIASAVLQEAKNPVVVPSANITDHRPAVEADEVLGVFSGKIDMVLDGGPCKYKKSSTVVKASPKGLEILRAGVYSQSELENMSRVQFLFVCTGNTCRSPMAVGIFRKYLAKNLKCEVDELNKMGYKIVSAGILDIAGSPASAEAIKTCASKGIDIKSHKSQVLTRELVEDSDFVYVMGQIHCERVKRISPDAARRCVLLAENEEIPDPIGQSQEFYNNCGQQIEQAVKKRISELVL